MHVTKSKLSSRAEATIDVDFRQVEQLRPTRMETADQTVERSRKQARDLCHVGVHTPGLATYFVMSRNVAHNPIGAGALSRWRAGPSESQRTPSALATTR